MPSLYDQSTGSGTFGQNARKTVPSTRFGTRQIQRISIYTTADTKTGYLESNSLFSQLVRALQQNVELYAVHRPDQAFYTCWGAYCFQIDVAYDTANDIWNAVNSSIDDDDPANWYYGPVAGADTNGRLGNMNSMGLIDVVRSALYSAGYTEGTDFGQNGYAWAMVTWVSGDMTWPGNDGNLPGSGSVPELSRSAPPAASNPDLAIQPGDTDETRRRKIAKWIKTLNT